jgi:histidyl-tRNA synthetase
MVVGENELAEGQFTVRNLESGHEETLPREALAGYILNS